MLYTRKLLKRPSTCNQGGPHSALSLIRHWQSIQKELITYKQHIFTTLNHNYNAMVHLTRQKWFRHGRADFDNTFQNKTRFCKL